MTGWRRTSPIWAIAAAALLAGCWSPTGKGEPDQRAIVGDVRPCNGVSACRADLPPIRLGTASEVATEVFSEGQPVARNLAPGAVAPSATAVAYAIRAGRWLDALALALLLVVFVARRIGALVCPWLRTRAGGWSLNFGTAACVAVASEILAGTSITVGTALDGLLVGLAAAGAYQLAKDTGRKRDAPTQV